MIFVMFQKTVLKFLLGSFIWRLFYNIIFILQMKAFTFVVAAENLVQLMQLIVDLKTHVFHYVYTHELFICYSLT